MARHHRHSDLKRRPKIVSRLGAGGAQPRKLRQCCPTWWHVDLQVRQHYCSVDNSTARPLDCGYFNSGIRVFDIRNPRRPKEDSVLQTCRADHAEYRANHNNGFG